MFRIIELLAAAAGIVTALLIMWDRFVSAPFPVDMELDTSPADADTSSEAGRPTQALLRMRLTTIGHLIIEEISAPGCRVDIPRIADQARVYRGDFQKVARPNTFVRPNVGEIVEYPFLVRPERPCGETKLVKIRIGICYVGTRT